MSVRRILTKVAGVTFYNRQSVLAEAKTGQCVLFRPEPENPFDANAIAVWLAQDVGGAKNIGYLPRDMAAEIAPAIEGESLLGRVFEITGGFEKRDGSIANYGVIVEVEIPDDVLRAD